MAAFWTPPAPFAGPAWDNAPRPSVIVCATAYAGSTSLLRILRRLAAGRYTLRTPQDDLWVAGRPEAAAEFADYRAYGEIYFWRHISVALESLRHAGLPAQDLRFVVAYRDPRDVVASDYVNRAFSHPLPPTPDHRDAFLAAREATRALGADRFALGEGQQSYRDTTAIPLFELLAQTRPSSVCLLSYASLCLDLPGFVDRLVRFLRLAPAVRDVDVILQTEDVRRRERMPRESNVHFSHASPLPGRFRRELAPDTIASLNHDFADVLAWMADVDDPAFAASYGP